MLGQQEMIEEEARASRESKQQKRHWVGHAKSHAKKLDAFVSPMFRSVKSFVNKQHIPRHVTSDLASVQQYFDFQSKFRAYLALLALLSIFFTAIQLEDYDSEGNAVARAESQTLPAACVSICTLAGIYMIYKLYLAKTLRMSVFGTTLMRLNRRKRKVAVDAANGSSGASGKSGGSQRATDSESNTSSPVVTPALTASAAPPPAASGCCAGDGRTDEALTVLVLEPDRRTEESREAKVRAEDKTSPARTVKFATGDAEFGETIESAGVSPAAQQNDESVPELSTPRNSRKPMRREASFAEVAARAARNVAADSSGELVPITGIRLIFGSPHFVSMLLEMLTWLIHQPPYLDRVWPDSRTLDIFVLLRVYSIVRWARGAMLGRSVFTRVMSYFAGIQLDSFFFMRVVFIRYPWVTPVSLCLLAWVLLSIMFHHIEGIGFLDSMYWVIVTTSTIGYGDLTPKTRAGKFFVTIVWLCGCILVGWVVVQVHSMLRFTPREEAFFQLLELNRRSHTVESLAARTIQSAFRVYRAKGVRRNALFWHYNKCATLFRNELREFRTFVASQPEGSIVRLHERSRKEQQKMKYARIQDTRHDELVMRMNALERKLDALLDRIGGALPSPAANNGSSGGGGGDDHSGPGSGAAGMRRDSSGSMNSGSLTGSRRALTRPPSLMTTTVAQRPAAAEARRGKESDDDDDYYDDREGVPPQFLAGSPVSIADGFGNVSFRRYQ